MNILRSDLAKFNVKNIKLTSHALSRSKERIELSSMDLIAEIEIKNKIIYAIKHNNFFSNGNKIFLNSQIKDKKNKELYFVMNYKEKELVVITLKPTSINNKLESIN